MKTPTQFIRHAALLAPVIIGEKTINYKDVKTESVRDQTCHLCGGKTDGIGISTKTGIKDTFTDVGYARQTASKSLCAGCAFCLSYREMRNYSIVATETELIHPDRARLQQLLIHPPDPPFIICIAVSGQKWVHFKGEVVYSRERFVITMEDTQVVVEPSKFEKLSRLIEVLMMEFSKAEIESGNYSQARIKKFGLTKWEMIDQELSAARGNNLFKLAVHTAQKREEEPCILDLIPEMSMLDSHHSSSTPHGGAEIKSDSRSIPKSGDESSGLLKAAQSEQLTWDIF